jgi:uncharacterized membrane protein YfcA
METFGYIAAIFIGISLGLIGGGGSILTVPVLVYLFRIDAIIATTYSLFIVGLTSAFGSVSYFKNKLVNLKVAITFGVPSVISVFITRNYLLPLLPDQIMSIGNFLVTKNILLMLLFAILMIMASWSMIAKGKTPESENSTSTNYTKVILQGTIVGMVTGLVGAGGGFLIIPALVKFLKLPIKSAIGTSLVIITLNSLLGFVGSMSNISIDWSFLGTIAAIAIVGIFIGTYLSLKINGAKLKPAFGWFVLVMGIYILLKEIFL